MLRVLVADDDPGIVRTLMLGLKMMGTSLTKPRF